MSLDWMPHEKSRGILCFSREQYGTSPKRIFQPFDQIVGSDFCNSSVLKPMGTLAKYRQTPTSGVGSKQIT